MFYMYGFSWKSDNMKMVFGDDFSLYLNSKFY